MVLGEAEAVKENANPRSGFSDLCDGVVIRTPLIFDVQFAHASFQNRFTSAAIGSSAGSG